MRGTAAGEVGEGISSHVPITLDHAGTRRVAGRMGKDIEVAIGDDQASHDNKVIEHVCVYVAKGVIFQY